jgi:hypothetical protein
MLNLEQTCNNLRLHSPARTVIRARLSAQACQPFCCQRTLNPSLSECSGCTGTRLAGLSRSSSTRVLQVQPRNPLRDLAFQLCLLDGLCCHAPLQQIKNPASSAGYSHPHSSGSTRCSFSFYPVLVENPTIGSTSRLRLFLPWEDFLRSDRDAPEQSSTLQSLRTISNDTSFCWFVKPVYQLFFTFPQPCGFMRSTKPPLGNRRDAGHGVNLHPLGVKRVLHVPTNDLNVCADGGQGDLVRIALAG